MKFQKCIMCYYGHKCNSNPKLPRKTKKFIKKVCDTKLMLYLNDRDDILFNICSCSLGDVWKTHKRIFRRIWKYRKLANSIKLLKEYDGKPILIFSDLSLNWEYSNHTGFYETDNTVPFQYIDKKDGTWAFKETKALLNFFNITENVTSDLQLLQILSKK